MKIKLGPYINRWTTCSLENRYLNWSMGTEHYLRKESSYSFRDKFVIFWLDVLQEFYNKTINIYLDRKQRKIKIKIDRYDTWGMDHTLSMIILPMLKQLKATKQGYPMVDDEDVPEELRTGKPNDEEEGDTNRDDFDEGKWDWVLDEMIFTFECLVDENYSDKFHTGVHDTKFVPCDADGNTVPEDDAVLYRWEKGPNDTSHYDMEGHKKLDERLQRGTTLFGKYFRNLWD